MKPFHVKGPDDVGPALDAIGKELIAHAGPPGNRREKILLILECHRLALSSLGYCAKRAMRSIAKGTKRRDLTRRQRQKIDELSDGMGNLSKWVAYATCERLEAIITDDPAAWLSRDDMEGE